MVSQRSKEALHDLKICVRMPGQKLPCGCQATTFLSCLISRVFQETGSQFEDRFHRHLKHWLKILWLTRLLQCAEELFHFEFSGGLMHALLHNKCLPVRENRASWSRDALQEVRDTQLSILKILTLSTEQSCSDLGALRPLQEDEALAKMRPKFLGTGPGHKALSCSHCLRRLGQPLSRTRESPRESQVTKDIEAPECSSPLFPHPGLTASQLVGSCHSSTKSFRLSAPSCDPFDLQGFKRGEEKKGNLDINIS